MLFYQSTINILQPLKMTTIENIIKKVMSNQHQEVDKIENLKLFIPYVFDTVSKEQMKEIFTEKVKYGKLKTIDFVAKVDKNKLNYNSAYIYFDFWFPTAENARIQAQIKQYTKSQNKLESYKLNYDSHSHWIVLENTSPTTTKQERTSSIGLKTAPAPAPAPMTKQERKPTIDLKTETNKTVQAPVPVPTKAPVPPPPTPPTMKRPVPAPTTPPVTPPPPTPPAMKRPTLLPRPVLVRQTNLHEKSIMDGQLDNINLLKPKNFVSIDDIIAEEIYYEQLGLPSIAQLQIQRAIIQEDYINMDAITDEMDEAEAWNEYIEEIEEQCDFCEDNQDGEDIAIDYNYVRMLERELFNLRNKM